MKEWLQKKLTPENAEIELELAIQGRDRAMIAADKSFRKLKLTEYRLAHIDTLREIEHLKISEEIARVRGEVVNEMFATAERLKLERLLEEKIDERRKALGL